MTEETESTVGTVAMDLVKSFIEAGFTRTEAVAFAAPLFVQLMQRAVAGNAINALRIALGTQPDATREDGR